MTGPGYGDSACDSDCDYDSVAVLSCVPFACYFILLCFCPIASCLQNGQIIASPTIMGNAKVMLLVVSSGPGKPSTGSAFQLLLLQFSLPRLTDWSRLATSVCQLRHDQMEQGPTEPHAGRSTFLLSSGGAGDGYYRVAFDTGPIPTENQFPCQTLVACLDCSCLMDESGFQSQGTSSADSLSSISRSSHDDSGSCSDSDHSDNSA